MSDDAQNQVGNASTGGGNDVTADAAARRRTLIDEHFFVLECSGDGTIVECNARAAEIMAWDPAQLAGRPYGVLVPKSTRASSAHRKQWGELGAGLTVEGQFPLAAADGGVRWLQLTCVPRLSEAGELLHVTIFGTDITAPKVAAMAAQEELRAISRQFAIIRFEPDGTILECNELFTSVMGHSADDLRGRPHSNLVPSDVRESAAYAEHWQALARGEPQQIVEARRLRRDGSEVWLSGIYAPMKDGLGNVTRVVKYAIDVTPQVKLRVSVDRLIADVSEVMLAMSEGDLSRRVDTAHAGDFSRLVEAINDTCERLGRMMGQIRESANAISERSGSVVGGNQTLAQRVEEQASFLEQTAANMEEMTATVKQNADSARQADELAAQACGVATHGGEVVSRAVAAMREINVSSRKISDIITVIDEIAFQTNLLALNAAVEAARAGEEGSGFAVVASEVRNLAQRSASAAKDIKSLIQDSMSKVEEGSRLVDESGANLESIVSSVRQVSELITDIATASSQQSNGIEEISRAISHMDQMTQQSAALTEEATAASEAAGQEADALLQLVSFFRSGPGDTAVAPATPGGGAPAVERRGPGRPWADRRQAASQGNANGADARAAAAGAGGAAAASADDDDWSEF